MTKTVLTLAVLATLAGCAAPRDPQIPAALSRDLDGADAKQKLAYAAGYQHAKTLLAANNPFDKDAFSQGWYDALLERQPRLAVGEAEQVGIGRSLVQFNLDAAREVALKQGRQFLAQNKTRPEVKTLGSGLQYQIEAAGAGNRSPKPEDSVQIMYRLTRIDGSELAKEALPGLSLRKSLVGKLPKGLQEALALMVEGAKWRLYLPPDLMHGANGSLSHGILPNETLICELELDSIQPGQP